MSKRDAYVKKLKAQLDEWSAELDKLETKARKAKGEIKIKYEEQVASLRRQRDEAKQKLAQIQEVADNAWEELKQGAEDTWAKLKKAFSKARSQFK